jgi:hypothetical protein
VAEALVVAEVTGVAEAVAVGRTTVASADRAAMRIPSRLITMVSLHGCHIEVVTLGLP